jgi:WD40 repeat protein
VNGYSNNRHYETYSNKNVNETEYANLLLKSYKSLDRFLCISDCYRVENCKVISFNSSDKTCKYYDSNYEQSKLIDSIGTVIYFIQPYKLKAVQDFQKISDCRIFSSVVLRDDKIVFGCGWNPNLYIYNLYDFSRVSILKGVSVCSPSNSSHCLHTPSLGILKNGSIVSGSGDFTVKIWDVTKGLINSLKGHNGGITKVIVLQNQEIVSGSSDSTIIVWNSLDGSIKYNLTTHTKAIDDIIQLKDGNVISTSSGETSLKLWNSNNWTLISSFSAKAVKMVQLNNGDISFYNGNTNGFINVIDRFKFLTKFSTRIKTHWVFTMTALEKNRFIESSAGDSFLRIHNLNNLNLKVDLIGHKDRVYAIIQLKNGYILSAGWDSIIIWK